jgi:hypothetical protein
MSRKMQAFGAAMLGGLLASVACSSSNNDAGFGSGGASGGGASGGTTNSGGLGGSSTRGGSGGKAGSMGAAGKGGTSSGGGSSGSAGTTTSEGGAAGEGAACPGCASGFCLSDGTCVDCLPSNDHCAAGQYCTAANTCAPGCKADGSTCASGVCLATHDCKNCISDSECNIGNVCGAGTCAPACSAAQEGEPADCSTDLTCCSLHCTDLKTDSNHCGACGTPCGGTQFCGVSAGCSDSGEGGAGGAGSQNACVACHDTTIANLCSITNVIVISDQDKNTTDGNLAPARVIGTGLHSQCPSTPTESEELQNTPDALNITTGHPVSGGGTLLVVAGGPYYQNLEGYFEQSTSPLYATSVGDTQEFIERANGAVVVSRSASTDNLSHDFFIIQFMRDPSSGSLVLNAQGFWQSGTTAAAFYFANAMLPALSTYDKSWYAYEWTDANGDMAPDLNEIVLQASAP